MRIVHALFALLFGLSVFVQLNDPDPLPWVLLYGAAAVVAVFALFGAPPREAAVALALLACVWATSLLPSAMQFDVDGTEWHMKAGDVVEEEARECAGLFLVAVSGIAVVVDANRRRRRSSPDYS